MVKLVLYGAGGFGKEVAIMVEVINYVYPTFELLGYIDDTEGYAGRDIYGYPCLGGAEWLLEHKDEVFCTCTVADPHAKARIQEEMEAKGVHFMTIIALGGFICKETTIGDGSVIYGDVNISVNCKIGKGVVINQKCTIGHDVEIGDYTSIMPGTGISGGVSIGKRVNVGGHAFIVPKRKIGDDATVAAGSVVFSNVKAGSTVLGNPARRMKELE